MMHIADAQKSINTSQWESVKENSILRTFFETDSKYPSHLTLVHHNMPRR